jgi:hypothetical protein
MGFFFPGHERRERAFIFSVFGVHQFELGDSWDDEALSLSNGRRCLQADCSSNIDVMNLARFDFPIFTA